MRKRFPVAFVAFVLAWFGVDVMRHGVDPIADSDEAQWIFASAYFHLAFVEGNCTGPEWRSIDALDHPPFAKVIYGAALVPRGLGEATLARKVWVLDEARRLDHLPALYAALEQMISPATRLAARATSAAFWCVSTLLLFWIATRVFDVRVGVIAALLFMLAPVVREWSVRAVSDPIFLALALALIALTDAAFVETEKERSSRPRALMLAILAGCAAGFMASTKITGAIGAPIAIAALFVASGPRADGLRRALPPAAVLGMTAAIVALATNPTLWASPVEMVGRFLEERVAGLAGMKIIMPGALHRTAGMHVGSYAGDFIMGQGPLFSHGLGWLVGLAFFFALTSMRPSTITPRQRALLLFALAWLLLGFATYQMRFSRWLVVGIPWFALLAAVGFTRIATAVRERTQSRAVLVSFTLSGALLLASSVAFNYWTRERDEAEHPELWQAMREEGLRAVLAWPHAAPPP